MSYPLLLQEAVYAMASFSAELRLLLTQLDQMTEMTDRIKGLSPQQHLYILTALKTEVICWIRAICRYKGPGSKQNEDRKAHIITPWHGNTFRIIGPLWGESSCHQWIPFIKGLSLQRTNNTGFDNSLLFILNELLNKQTSGWWFETPRRSCDINEFVSNELRRTYHIKRWTKTANILVYNRF